MDPDYERPEMESRDVFGFTLQQRRNAARISADLFRRAVTAQQDIPADALQTLIVATIALKYTQSNSVCVAVEGQVIGMGAGPAVAHPLHPVGLRQGDKWFLQQHPRVLRFAFRKARRGRKRPTWSISSCSGISSRLRRGQAGGPSASAPEPLSRDGA